MTYNLSRAAPGAFTPCLIQNQLRGSVDSGVISQRCQGKQSAAASGEGIRHIILLNIIQKNRTGL